MKSLADGLPAPIAKQVHPDWRKNEAEYWAIRDQLLVQYQDQWIGFADGKVIATGTKPIDVLLAIQKSGKHPFVIRVGHENEPWYRIRRASFAYDAAHSRRLQADFMGRERILGRDMLNRIDVIFRGPTGEVVVNP